MAANLEGHCSSPSPAEAIVRVFAAVKRRSHTCALEGVNPGSGWHKENEFERSIY